MIRLGTGFDELRGSRSPSREIEERIAGLAAVQHGVITRAQLLEAGLTISAVRRRLATGRLRPFHLGVYLVGPIMPPRAVEMAAVLATANDSLVSHASAASLWIPAPSVQPPNATRASSETRAYATSPLRAPAVHLGTAGIAKRPAAQDGGAACLVALPAEPVDITVVGANSGRRAGIRVHRLRQLEESERAVLEGIPVTSPARTLLDLAAVVGTRDLEHAVARAEREGLATREALNILVARHPRRPGTPALRAVLESEGGPTLTRSEAEAKFHALTRCAGLPPPEINVRVGPYELDFLWRAEGIAVEVDGFLHHSSRPRFEGDRRKDAWLLANGITVIRLSWRQIVHEPVATAVLIGQALARAKVVHR